MVGVGVGGITVPFDVLAEFTQTSDRARTLLKMDYFWSLGSFVTPFLAWSTISSDLSKWHNFVFLCSIFCVLSFITSYLYIPESPLWLREQEAKKRIAMSLPSHASSKKSLPQDEKREIGIVALYNSDIKVLPIFSLWFFFGFSYYSLLLVTASTLPSTSTFAFKEITISCFSEFVAVTLATVLVQNENVGRRKLQIWGYAAAAPMAFLFCLQKRKFDSEIFLVYIFLKVKNAALHIYF